MVVNTRYLALIIHTDIQFTTAGIGKATYPFQVFVTPVGFVFYVVGVGHIFYM